MKNLYYLQTNIICILILLIIYLSLRNRTHTLPARRVAFNRLLIIIAIISFFDIFAWFYSGQMIPGARTMIQVSNIVYDAAITWAGYAWLTYVDLRIRTIDYDYKKRRRVTAIPLVIMLVLLVTNPLTNLFFTIDENNVYARGNGIFLHWIISWFYLIYATVEVIRKIKKSTSNVEREQYMPMLWFIVPPVVAAALQMFFYGLTTTQCGMTLAAIIIAMNFMIAEVSKDMLTGLNNRRALQVSIIERLQKAYANITVLMCDIDNFKQINDTLGHTAGDLALKRMAEVLKLACTDDNHVLYLCRYGGDEFVVCGVDMTRGDIMTLVKKIEDSVKAVNKEYQSDLNFSISVGEATGFCSTYGDVEALISTADAMMYEVKESKGATR